MNDNDTTAALSRIEAELEEIAGIHGARLEQATLPDGLIVRTIETDETMIARGEGHSNLEAASHLLSDAKAGGRA